MTGEGSLTFIRQHVGQRVYVDASRSTPTVARVKWRPFQFERSEDRRNHMKEESHEN